MAKRKLVPVCAKRLHRLGRLAVDEQVGRVYAIHRHAELDLHRVQRLHCQPRGRIGASDIRWVVVGEGVRPAVPGGGCLERIGRKRLVGDPVILHPRQLDLAVRQWPRLEHPRPSPAGHGQRRLAIDQQVGGVDSLNRFVEIYRDLLEVRRQSARGQGGGDHRRIALVRHNAQLGVEHDVRAGAALVQHDDREGVFAILQHRLEVVDFVVQKPQRLRGRLGGLAAVLWFFRGDVVSRHLRAVDVGDEPVVDLGTQRGRGDVFRVGAVEFLPDEKRVVLAFHVGQFGAALHFFTKENRRNRGFPAGVVEVRLIPRPVIRLAWGALPTPEVPRRLIIDQRHRLAKRQPGKERQSKQKAPSRPVFEIIHAGGNVANRPRYSMPQWLR